MPPREALKATPNPIIPVTKAGMPEMLKTVTVAAIPATAVLIAKKMPIALAILG